MSQRLRGRRDEREPPGRGRVQPNRRRGATRWRPRGGRRGTGHALGHQEDLRGVDRVRHARDRRDPVATAFSPCGQERLSGRRRTPAFPEGWRPPRAARQRRDRPRSRGPGPQSPARRTRWPRRSKSRTTSSPIRSSTTARGGPRARPEGIGQRRGVEGGRVDGLLWLVAADEHAQQHRELPLILLIPPGDPIAMISDPRVSIVGVSVVRGRRPGVRDAGCPGSSHVACRRVPRQNPRPGTLGDDCSQPPDGVAEIVLPHRSTTSR